MRSSMAFLAGRCSQGYTINLLCDSQSYDEERSVCKRRFSWQMSPSPPCHVNNNGCSPGYPGSATPTWPCASDCCYSDKESSPMALEDASPSAIERVDVSSSMYLDNLAALAVASGLRAENLRVSVDSSSGWSSQVSPASLAVGSVKREAETPFARTSSSSESIEDEVSGVERSPTPRKTRPSSPHRPHICRECKKGFTTSGHVARHMRIHTGVKPYPCLLPDCQARFSRQDNMMQHYRTHLLKLQKSTASTTGFVVELKNLKSLADKGVKQAEKPSSSVSTRSKRKRQTVKSKVNSQPTAPRKARAKPVQGGSDQSGRSPEGSQSGYPSLTEHVRPIMDMTPPPSARKTRSSGREENSRGVDTPVQMSSRRKTAKRARKARE